MDPINSTLPAEAKLEAMHKQWCSITGRTDSFGFNRREWWEFSRMFDEATLENVLRYIVGENRKRDKKYQIKLHLAEIIGDLQRFDALRADADLARREADARKRAYQPSAGERELAAMRHEQPQPPKTEAKKVDIATVIAAMRSAVGSEQKG